MAGAGSGSGSTSVRRATFARDASAVAKWEFERIIPCHGDVVEGDGKKAWLKAFERVSATVEGVVRSSSSPSPSPSAASKERLTRLVVLPNLDPASTSARTANQNFESCYVFRRRNSHLCLPSSRFIFSSLLVPLVHHIDSLPLLRFAPPYAHVKLPVYQSNLSIHSQIDCIHSHVPPVRTYSGLCSVMKLRSSP